MNLSAGRFTLGLIFGLFGSAFAWLEGANPWWTAGLGTLFAVLTWTHKPE